LGLKGFVVLAVFLLLLLLHKERKQLANSAFFLAKRKKMSLQIALYLTS
jgi:hypothetical protein